MVKQIWLALVCGVGAVAAPDECSLFYDNISHVQCNRQGMCQHFLSDAAFQPISCEQAARGLAHRYGSRPIPELPHGLVRPPVLWEERTWPPRGAMYVLSLMDAYPGEMSESSISVPLNALQSSLSRINDELDYWAPRVLYIPGRVQGALASAYQAIKLLKAAGAVARVNHLLDKSEMVENFCSRVMYLVNVVIRLGDARHNGYLNALIPFLHLFAELTAFVPLINISAPGFDAHRIELILTVSQFQPMYTDTTLWRFRVINHQNNPWQSRAREWFWLPMDDLLEARAMRQTFQSLECPNSVDVKQCQLAVERLAAETTRPVEFIENLLRLFETTRLDPIYGFVADAILRVCDPDIPLSGFTSQRSFSLLLTYFPQCSSLKTRIHYALELNNVRTNIRTQAAINVGSTPAQMLSFVASIPSAHLHANFIQLVSKQWVQTFFMNVGQLAPNETELPRAMGRVLGYAIWRGDLKHEVEQNILFAQRNGRNPSYMDVLFMGSDQVRLGFYDWFSYGLLENVVAAEELGAALRMYSQSQSV